MRRPRAEPSATVVELENPLASPQPLQGYLRQANSAGPSPAVVLLHGCNGNWRRLDERWGKRIASWGYVTLTVDSFGPRGLKNTCDSGAPVDLAFDAYRALNFLVRQPFVDPARVAALGFSQGGWLALTSVERGIVEQTSPNKFRAAIAFYPPCLAFKGDMTVPTLILVGELDDWTPADGVPQHGGWPRRLGHLAAEGPRRSDQAHRLSRRLSRFRRPGPQDADAVSRASPRIQPGGNGSIDRRACANFLDATIGGKEQSQVTIKAVVFDAYGTLYDIQSVAAVTEEAFPGYGEIITQIWRIKQLEYTWLRSLMRRYEDFSVVTRESLAYTLRVLGLQHDAARSSASWTNICISISIRMRWRRWRRCEDRKLAILSNGSTGMLNALVPTAGSTACSMPPSASTPGKSSSRRPRPTA